MLNKRGHGSEFRHQSPGCPHYLIVSLLCFGLFQWGLWEKSALEEPNAKHCGYKQVSDTWSL